MLTDEKVSLGQNKIQLTKFYAWELELTGCIKLAGFNLSVPRRATTSHLSLFEPDLCSSQGKKGIPEKARAGPSSRGRSWAGRRNGIQGQGPESEASLVLMVSPQGRDPLIEAPDSLPQAQLECIWRS